VNRDCSLSGLSASLSHDDLHVYTRNVSRKPRRLDEGTLNSRSALYDGFVIIVRLIY